MDRETGNFKRFYANPEALKQQQNIVTSIVEDKSGQNYGLAISRQWVLTILTLKPRSLKII